MLKKLFVVLALAACAISCLKDNQSYSASYTLDTTFEYGDVFGSRDSLYFDKSMGVGIGWQDLGFYHKLNGDKTEFLGGFILSRLKGNGDSDQNRFRVNSGVGMNKSRTYMVYYQNPVGSEMPEKDIEFTSKLYGTCEVIGCFVNNTKEVLDAVKESFVDGDKLAIKMTGYLNGKATGTQEFVLAEYTEQKDSLVTSWSAFKLDKLGQVDLVDIDIISTRNDIPKAFCLDDMVATITLAY